MVIEIKKEDWENAKKSNENHIIGNMMQIEIAKEITKLCERKIKEFKDEKKDEKKPIGVG